MFEDNNYNDRDGVFSKAVKAGRRTYFFDVKTTRDNDFYITITESKNSLTVIQNVLKSTKFFCTKKILKSLKTHWEKRFQKSRN